MWQEKQFENTYILNLYTNSHLHTKIVFRIPFTEMEQHRILLKNQAHLHPIEM